ncbi:MAG: ABC transporter permease, partial [Muribaculaceae bacterium]
MFDLIREIYQTLRNNKLRTFLTGFAVAWGIFMLIILLGMARGVVNGFENSKGSKGTNNVNVFNGRTSKAYAGYKEGRYIQLKNSDTQTVKDDVKNHVDVATAFVEGSSSVISTPHDYISAKYTGVYPNFLSLRGEEMQEGRFINDMDMQLQRKVLVITRKN